MRTGKQHAIAHNNNNKERAQTKLSFCMCVVRVVRSFCVSYLVVVGRELVFFRVCAVMPIENKRRLESLRHRLKVQ